jgi:acetolactate synthase-1/2/3 large subunit
MNRRDALTHAFLTDPPLATTFMTKGVLPADHPQMLFAVGQPEDDIIDLALEPADLIVTVGFDPIEYATSHLTQGDTPVVALSLTPSPLDGGWYIAAEAVGDLAQTFG